jgi:hypothetical protein
MTMKEAFIIELTLQEQHAVDGCSEPRLIDPRTQKAYVLVEAEVFGRFREFIAEGEGIETLRPTKWPDGFFDQIRIDDPAFVRPPQGETPPSPSFDCAHALFTDYGNLQYI